MPDKILVVAAHPDDETLGCGATLLRHKKEQKKIYWLIVTDIYAADGFAQKKIKSRSKEIDMVSRAYDFSGVFKLRFPSTRLDKVPISQIIKRITQVIKTVKPTIIYLPHEGDSHTDHQITHKAVIASTKSFRAPGIKRILAYETVSETEFATANKKNAFLPNVFVDTALFLDKKIEIMKIYKDEIRRFPFPRSTKNLKALATFRGAMMGTRYAEAFMHIREFI